MLPSLFPHIHTTFLPLLVPQRHVFCFLTSIRPFALPFSGTNKLRCVPTRATVYRRAQTVVGPNLLAMHVREALRTHEARFDKLLCPWYMLVPKGTRAGACATLLTLQEIFSSNFHSGTAII